MVLCCFHNMMQRPVMYRYILWEKHVSKKLQMAHTKEKKIQFLCFGNKSPKSSHSCCSTWGKIESCVNKNYTKSHWKKWTEASLLQYKPETCTSVCFAATWWASSLWTSQHITQQHFSPGFWHPAEMSQGSASVIYCMNWNVLKICHCITAVDIVHIDTDTLIYITFENFSHYMQGLPNQPAGL